MNQKTISICTLVLATLTTVQGEIRSDFDDGAYPGDVGGGWVAGWAHTEGGTPEVISENPLDEGTPYLHVDFTEPNVRNVLREYQSGGGVDISKPHIIRWKFRLDEDPTEFANNFTTFDDRVNFFARNAPRPGGGTDASMSWGIYAVGAEHSSGAGAGQTFWLYDNVSGDSGFTLENNLDTGVPLIPNNVYTFELTVDEANQEFTLSITNEDTGDTFTSAEPHTFRDLSDVTHSIMHFGVRVTDEGEARAFDVDSVSIEPVSGTLLTPSIVNVNPADGSVHLAEEGLQFDVVSEVDIPEDGISLVLNGTDVTADLAISGDANTRSVEYTGLEPDTEYTAEISATNAEGSDQVTVQFTTLAAVAASGPIRSDFDDEIYPGTAGNGWVDGWSQSEGGTPVITAEEPLTGGTPYLQFDLTGTGVRNVARQYETALDVDASQPHRIQWRFRLAEDPDAFANNFTTFNDRVHFFGRNEARLGGSTDGSMSYGVFAVGDAHSSGVGAGQTFWIYDNATGDSGFNLDNAVDTGMPLVPNDVYFFEVSVNPEDQSYQVTIRNETSGERFASSEPHTFRDLSATLTSHTILHFGVQASEAAEARAFDLDSVLVAPLPTGMIVSDFNDGVYPGSPGLGWVLGWANSGGELPEILSDDPLEGDTPYLHVDYMGTAGGYRNVMREYEIGQGVDITQPHTIQWKFRLDEDQANFDANFNEFNDRVHFFSRNAPRLGGGTDASMSWGVYAVGDEHATGSGAGQTFWVYDNLTGDSAFTLENNLDTGVPLVPNQTYAFSVTVDPANQVSTLSITNEESGETFTSESPHTFRDTSAGLQSHTMLHFGVRASSSDDEPRAFDLDSVKISPAGTLVPLAIQGLMPEDLSSFHPADEGFRFEVVSIEPIPEDAITLILNGTDVSSQLEITGEPTNRSVAYNGLQLNTLYQGEIRVSNAAGESTVSFEFDTFLEENILVVEAEDYNYQSGQFQDDPPPSGFTAGGEQINGNGVGYVDLVGTTGVDYVATAPAAPATGETYRFSDSINTQYTDDVQRDKYVEAGVPDYEVFQIGAGTWMNYTRTFNANEYQVQLRAQASAAQSVLLERVTSDRTQPDQTTAELGQFEVPETGGEFELVPLTDGEGNPQTVSLDGVETLRLTASEANQDLLLNYVRFAAVPEEPLEIVLTGVSLDETGFQFQFQTEEGQSYEAQKSSSLVDPSWTMLEEIQGDGSVMTVTDPDTSDSEAYYRVTTQ